MKEKSRLETTLKGGDVTDCKRLQGMTRRSSLRRCRLKPPPEKPGSRCVGWAAIPALKGRGIGSISRTL